MESDRSVRERACVGHRARGLQRGRRCLELLSARPRALAGLPLERRRARRNLRSRTANVFCAGAVERPRSVPEGTHLRSVRHRRKSRRRREGVLVVCRRHADRVVAAMALSLSAGRVPLCAFARRECAARPHAARVRPGTYRRVRRAPLLAGRGRLREGGAERRVRAHPHPQRGTRCGGAARVADVVVPQSMGVGSERGAPVDPRGRRPCGVRSPRRNASADGCSKRVRAAAARRSCCSATTTRTSRGCSPARRRRRIRKTASTTTS